MARKPKLDAYTTDPRDALELMARLLVSGGYRIPTEGRGTGTPMRASDIAGAVGLMADSQLAKQTALAVATRADAVATARITRLAYREVIIAVRKQVPRPLNLKEGADRHRLRLVTFDAAHELIWPERRRPYGLLAKDAKMRKAAYIAVHKCATSVLQQALNEGRSEFERRLFGHG